jgi:hypothetical protein
LCICRITVKINTVDTKEGQTDAVYDGAQPFQGIERDG